MSVTLLLRTVRDLDCLPTYAVVEDHNNQVWQKLPLTRNQLRNHRGLSYAWFKPGDATVYVAGYLAMPVRLLDDGL